VLEVAKAMVGAGSAQVVMGNHEFKALSYDPEWPAGSGKYARPHDDPDDRRWAKNTKQHAAFLEQVRGADRRRYLEWFATIPLWLDLGEVHVVHACWHDDSIKLVENAAVRAPRSPNCSTWWPPVPKVTICTTLSRHF